MKIGECEHVMVVDGEWQKCDKCGLKIYKQIFANEYREGIRARHLFRLELPMVEKCKKIWIAGTWRTG